ncbi:LOW QUALITY PROTEIN: pentatricopeptide repeat-containing protein At1g77170, mitochondrial-like [Dioscorea cayenensis subsp. rotundata]|uniref:LOW QUALITY PROTEIN: pentatricopeptide repeat-containing protein At1g77170, mitochondrial-like n=1 Tax=Dioscorea cayennensis subsp. rotundata TaxID=55577 RepID=A0AB40B5U3_DIOCR|nr:LOW QUALITY PROTEIN: pentatricopeptide repeat-containing protein At1g77170, mitochondrial-like [Dioscorea cayenensis subsp. rotundata]
MCSTNGLFRNLSKSINSLRLLPNIWLHLHLSCSPSPESDSDGAGAAANQLESCADPSLLIRLHSQMLRNHFLRSPFHWNALIRAYLRLASPRAALLLFIQMSRSGASPDSYTLPIIFKAISHSFMLVTGRQLHSLSIKHGLELNEYCNSGLINIYAKAGEFDHALKVFDESSERKLGSWNAIINGLAQGGHSKEAIRFFVQLRRSGLVPDDVTMVSVASACGSYGDLSLAQQVHKCMLQAQSLERLSIMRLNSLVDMYSKCGRTDLALKVFDKMPGRDVSSWTSMIMGLATQGEAKHALDHFDRMVQEGVRPNQVTFVAVLTACAHAGLADEAVGYFDAMRGRYGIEPMVAHYGCMVDVLGRVGRVEEAKKMVEGMPMRGNAVIWGTMLGACERYGKVEIGEWVAGKLLELEPWNDGVYVVLSNIYAACGMWAEVERVRRLMWERRVVKTPGFSAATNSN